MKLLKPTKGVIQTYLLTEARYKFSVYEKRIMYAIIELLQAELKGQKLNGHISTDRRYTRITLYAKRIFPDDGEGNHNHDQIIKALESLDGKRITVDNGELWESFSIIIDPKYHRGEGTLSFDMSDKMLETFRDFSKGYTVYDLQIARNFNNVYAMRMYELICHFRDRRTFELTIENFRKWLVLEDRIARNVDLKRYILDPCQKQLKEHSPHWYEYEMVKLGRSFHKIAFTLHYDESKDPAKREKARTASKTSPRWYIDRHTIAYLKEDFGFSDRELANNNLTFEQLGKKGVDVNLEVRIIGARMRGKDIKNKKGYVINSLKNLLK